MLDERNGTHHRSHLCHSSLISRHVSGIFGSSISNFSALNSPSRPAENSFLLRCNSNSLCFCHLTSDRLSFSCSPVGHVSNEPRSGHHVAWEGEDIDGDIYLGSSSKMDISGQVTSASAYKATTPAENRGIAGTMNHSPGLFGINGTCGEEDSVNMYGDARNPLSMVPFSCQLFEPASLTVMVFLRTRQPGKGGWWSSDSRAKPM